MAARTLAAAPLARLPADAVADGVVTGLVGGDGDGLGAGDFARDGRGESRVFGVAGFGLARGVADGIWQGADPAAAQAGVRESIAAVTLAAGSEWCSRT
jgi:hypothetical protein